MNWSYLKILSTSLRTFYYCYTWKFNDKEILNNIKSKET
jgi:hypothetical protein